MSDAQKETISTQDSEENQREEKDTNGISGNKTPMKGKGSLEPDMAEL